MDMEGISRLGEDIGLDPSKDVAILVLCWKLGAKTAGQISKDEFESGMERLEADSIATLTRLVPALDPGFMDPTKFRDFYRFAFQYSREGTTRTLEKELVAVLLPMVMANRSPHTADFVQFLEQSEMATRITFDQWSSFLEFSNSVRADLSGYDEDGASVSPWLLRCCRCSCGAGAAAAVSAPAAAYCAVAMLPRARRRGASFAATALVQHECCDAGEQLAPRVARF
ncbi:unnamed protein product [Phaeothamnion confervicola]